MSKSANAFRTISEVAEWLDTPAHVLRFWESKFTQVKPVKRAGGRRYYRPQDMMLLGGIKKLLHEDGMTIKNVQKLLRQEGVKYVAALSDHPTYGAGYVAPEPRPAPAPEPVAAAAPVETTGKAQQAPAPESAIPEDEPLPGFLSQITTPAPHEPNPEPATETAATTTPAQPEADAEPATQVSTRPVEIIRPAEQEAERPMPDILGILASIPEEHLQSRNAALRPVMQQIKAYLANHS